MFILVKALECRLARVRTQAWIRYHRRSAHASGMTASCLLLTPCTRGRSQRNTTLLLYSCKSLLECFLFFKAVFVGRCARSELSIKAGLILPSPHLMRSHLLMHSQLLLLLHLLLLSHWHGTADDTLILHRVVDREQGRAAILHIWITCDVGIIRLTATENVIVLVLLLHLHKFALRARAAKWC